VNEDPSTWDEIEYDYDQPMDRHRGRCHLCKNIGPITYCRVCRHWFDQPCRSKVFSRGIEAVKQLIAGRTEGCCGPVEEG